MRVVDSRSRGSMYPVGQQVEIEITKKKQDGAKKYIPTGDLFRFIERMQRPVEKEHTQIFQRFFIFRSY